GDFRLARGLRIRCWTRPDTVSPSVVGEAGEPATGGRFAPSSGSSPEPHWSFPRVLRVVGRPEEANAHGFRLPRRTPARGAALLHSAAFPLRAAIVFRCPTAGFSRYPPLELPVPELLELGYRAANRPLM